EMRQGQSLVMTPQLLQAIKLLQLSHLDLQTFVDAEVERNPLLERTEPDDAVDPREALSEPSQDGHRDAPDGADGFEDVAPPDWYGEELATARQGLEETLGTRLDNVFPDEAPQVARLEQSSEAMLPVMGSGAVGNGGSASFDEDLPGLEETLSVEQSLHEVLCEQLDVAVTDPVTRLIGRHLIDAIDDAGYLAEPLPEMAERLGVGMARLDAILAIIHTFEPSGVGARDLAECLAIQLKDKNRHDPAMATLLAHLPLLAKRDFAALRRLCGVDEDDLAEMIAEIRALDPKPGRAYGGGAAETVVPDVIVRAAPDGSWLIDLNPDTLPRVLVNQTYHTRVSKAARTDTDKAFIAECLQTANWLTRSLEQRARTILKVASEIVRQQDAFFAYGVEHLRPLNLKTVADAIAMHESTVSRVTSNKYLISPRGLFEMKYFFTASIASTGYGEAHSAEAVRYRIKAMIDAESGRDVLSDDAIVARLREQGIDIARRTVAKYREALGIGSSMERRRDKQAAQGRNR
ncbi:MAG: RNA polymerase factor sigma-54, partial [Beijerinckiaceae bacterium]|nr:RNA polymerase factor sigma-54 [Beijerinckiaceae bacterium]